MEKETVAGRKSEKEKVKARKEKERKEKVKGKAEKVKEKHHNTHDYESYWIGDNDGMKKSGMKILNLNNILLLCSLNLLKKAHSIVFSSSLQKDGSQGRREREFLLSLVCRTSAAGPRRHGGQLALAAGT